ncbi:MAG TPA: alginate lyase family protein [Bryobacteraceae bacterium]|nr:alginate lyase family protein [Bryobacteraceae bacterium]
MRSSAEIAFRLKQEFRNLSLLLTRPSLPAEPSWNIEFLPDAGSAAAQVRGTGTAETIIALAKQILQHRFPILGLEIDTGAAIRWRRDYVSGKETGLEYFRRIPYLDAARVGDHKMIWELNRHQHLVLLGQAYRLTGTADFRREIVSQLESWLEANPFQRGINWTSALEVGIRALSWVWVLHLIGEDLEEGLRGRLLTELYRHGLHLANNLSYYFSPNTHLLGEGVALHTLGMLFGGVPGAEEWAPLGTKVILEQMERQIRPDGSHFEQSSYYHLYALDMFLFHAAIAPPSDAYRATLTRMAEYLGALMGHSQDLPFLGDDDGGRFFHPYGPRKGFGRAALATCGVMLHRPDWIRNKEDLYEQAVWWLGPPALEGSGNVSDSHLQSRSFSDAGTVVMTCGQASCIVDAGPFGPFRAGHSHADTLSLVARSGESDLLIDAGTFTYVGDSRWRDIFRGTAAHNTVRLRGMDQADPAGPFAWHNLPQVAIQQWISSRETDYLDATCCYRNSRHRRRVLFLKPELLLFILDQVDCDRSAGPTWLAEQFWHPGAPVAMESPECFRIGDAGMLILDAEDGVTELIEDGEIGWRSSVFGAKESALVIVKRRHGKPLLRFGAVLAFSAPAQRCTLTVASVGNEVKMALTSCREECVFFPESGMPRRQDYSRE